MIYLNHFTLERKALLLVGPFIRFFRISRVRQFRHNSTSCLRTIFPRWWSQSPGFHHSSECRETSKISSLTAGPVALLLAGLAGELRVEGDEAPAMTGNQTNSWTVLGVVTTVVAEYEQDDLGIIPHPSRESSKKDIFWVLGIERLWHPFRRQFANHQSPYNSLTRILGP